MLSPSSSSSSPKPTQKRKSSCGPHPFLYRIHPCSARLEGTSDRRGKSMDAGLNEPTLVGETVRLHLSPSVLGIVAELALVQGFQRSLGEHS